MVNARHILGFRRKREGRTNYKKRLALLKSGKPRLVIRLSNRYAQLQIVRYDPDGDKVVVGLTSRILRQHGWKGTCISLPAMYLLGRLIAAEARKRGVNEAIVDLGLQRHQAGGRFAAAVKGAIDGGLAVPASAEVFPAPERLHGSHLADKGAAAQTVAKKLGVELGGEV